MILAASSVRCPICGDAGDVVEYSVTPRGDGACSSPAPELVLECNRCGRLETGVSDENARERFRAL